MPTTRRHFLRTSAAAGFGLGISGALDVWRVLANPLGNKADTNPVIVNLNLVGGNDLLNTLVPLHQYDRYRYVRPNLHIPREWAIPLPGAGDDLALNPGMTAIRDLYSKGKVALFPGSGLPHTASGLFDHEACQNNLQVGGVLGTASADSPTGWLGRYLDTVESGGVMPPGVNINAARTSVLAGDASVLTGVMKIPFTITTIDALGVKAVKDPVARMAGYSRIAGTPATGGAVAERNRLLRKQMLEVSALLRARTAGYTPAADYMQNNVFADSLRTCAQLITSNIGVRALGVRVEGFDTHAAQNDGVGPGILGSHDYLLSQVSDAVTAFQADLEAHGDSRRVLTLVVSEFGRRVGENTDRGTDHGLGGLSMAVGDAVRGGVYGTYPSLETEHQVLVGNLDTTTDFRSIYATVLDRFLDADPELILGGSFPRLGFL